MEESIERVAKDCAKQLDTFQRCVLANQKDPGVCDPYKRDLTQCAAQAVPLIRTLKSRCEVQVRSYDACLAANQHRGDEELQRECGPALRRLWECTEAVKREMDVAERRRGGREPGA